MRFIVFFNVLKKKKPILFRVVCLTLRLFTDYPLSGTVTVTVATALSTSCYHGQMSRMSKGVQSDLQFIFPSTYLSKPTC